ncbi:PQQ-binding-like beta-propeller repeat protein [Aquimarina sp. U1-2]|uniref:outer membrane protein assembly factor BamB family protein n=1 Tax=Aquimarina sp. U1-2 TaxID=2823141 RepID=UPI001AED0442|nr:PQQ-binding-like beta-propeller repeat protein [Aquimarina sp. U1-2]MBP2832183.1 PQQ-binding-like beta-propeller repeat protein [Aquimarina sp. U1-2]
MKLHLSKFSLLVLFVACNTIFAQRSADKQIAFDGKIEQLFFHEFSAVPIVLTDKTVAGIDAEKGTKIWEVEGDRISLLGGAIQTDQENYRMVPFSPYIIVANLLIDTRDGKVLLDKEKEGYKKIKSFQIIPELESFIFQCTTEDKAKNKAFLVSLKSNESKWNTELTIKKRGTLNNLVVDKNTNIAFSLGSNLFILNSTNGSVIFNEEEKIGKLFLNPSKDILYAVEAAGGGLGSMMGAAMTLNANKLSALGDKIHAFKVEDGSKAWKKPLKLDEGFMFEQEVDGKLFIKHEKAGSLYDYATGEKLWKKDFEKRRINDVEKVDEGYMVYYGARKILLDNNGKKVWKKPQFNGNDFLAEVGEDDTYDEFRYNKGSIIATPYRIAYYEDGVKKAIWKFGVDEDTRIAYDDQEKNLIVLDGKELYLLNPDKGWNKDNSQKLELKKHKDFNRLEVRGDNYYLSSPWEFAIVAKDGTVKKTKYYPQPGETGRKLLNTLSVLGEAAGAAYQVAGVYNMGMGATSGAAETFTGVRPPGTGGFKQADKGAVQYQAGAYGEMAAEALYNPNRYDGSANTRDYSFFFTKDNAETKYLVQVTKDGGEEKDKFTFEDNKPNYHVDQVEKRVFYTKGKNLNIFDYQ